MICCSCKIKINNGEVPPFQCNDCLEDQEDEPGKIGTDLIRPSRGDERDIKKIILEIKGRKNDFSWGKYKDTPKICTSCAKVAFPPLSANCGCMFCYACVEDWETKKECPSRLCHDCGKSLAEKHDGCDPVHAKIEVLFWDSAYIRDIVNKGMNFAVDVPELK